MALLWGELACTCFAALLATSTPFNSLWVSLAFANCVLNFANGNVEYLLGKLGGITRTFSHEPSMPQAAPSIYAVEIQTETLPNPVLVRCPTCGAQPGEQCELATGQARTNPHFDRRVIAKD